MVEGFLNHISLCLCEGCCRDCEDQQSPDAPLQALKDKVELFWGA